MKIFKYIQYITETNDDNLDIKSSDDLLINEFTTIGKNFYK